MNSLSKKGRFSLTASLALIFLLGVVFSFSSTAVAKKPYKIGTLLPLTGNSATMGPQQQNGDKLAIMNINEAGGIMGHDLKLIHRDSTSMPTGAVDAARKLVQVDNVPAIVGAFSSGVTKAVAQGVTIPNEVVQIGQGSTSPILSVLDDNDYFFRACMMGLYQGAALAKQVYDSGVRRLGIIYANNPYGLGLNDATAQRFKDLGGEVVNQVPHELGKATYSSNLDRVFSGDVDGVVMVVYPSDMKVMGREAIGKGYGDIPWFGCDAWQSQEVIDSIGAANLEGVTGTTQGVMKGTSYKRFLESYKKHFGGAPTKPFVSTGYDATVSIALAIARSGKSPGELTSKDIRDNLRPVTSPPGEKVYAGPEGLKKAFNLLSKGKEVNYIGAAGKVAYDKYGDAAAAVKIWRVENGQITTVKNVVPEPVSREKLGERYVK